MAVAKGELGYREGQNNWTKYAADPLIERLYGWNVQNQAWCCTFVNWCFLTAFGFDVGSRLTYGGTAACSASADLFKAAGAFVHFPEVGDQAFFYSGGGINHTGVVVAVQGTAVYTIEGNYSDKVSSVRHNVGAGDVAGFGRPCWSIVESGTETGGGSAAQEQPGKPAGNADAGEIQEDYSWRPKLLTMSNMYATDCVVLQALLNARHCACGSADGFFGPKTSAAVNKFQRWSGLEVDGVVGPATWEKLLEVKK